MKPDPGAMKPLLGTENSPWNCDDSPAVFRICIHLIRIQPKISIRIRIPDPDLVKFIEIIIFSFL
jgi:hypothetical protein